MSKAFLSCGFAGAILKEAYRTSWDTQKEVCKCLKIVCLQPVFDLETIFCNDLKCSALRTRVYLILCVGSMESSCAILSLPNTDLLCH